MSYKRKNISNKEDSLFTGDILTLRLFEKSPSPIFILDTELKIKEINNAARALLGYKSEYKKGSDFTSLLYEKKRSWFKKKINNLPSANKNRPIDICLQQKDGNYTSLKADISIIKNSKQVVSYLITGKYELANNGYHLILENIPNGFAYVKTLYDKDCKALDFVFLEVNSSFEQLTGLESSKIINKKLSSIADSDTVQEWIGIHNEAVHNGNQKCEKYFRLFNKWLLVSVSNHKKGYFGVSLEDINEKKNAEAAFKYERYLLQSLMDQIPDTIYFKDTRSCFTRINKAQAIMLGLKDPDEAIGKSDADFFPEDISRSAFNDEQEIIKSGNPLVNKQERIKKADGSYIWVSATKVPIFDDNGIVTGLVGISRDITKRVEGERELISTRQQLQNIFDNLDYVFWSRDIGENRFIRISPGCERLLGHTPEAFLKNSELLLDLVDERDKEKVKSSFENLNGATNATQFRIIRSNNKIRWVENNIKPTRDQNNNLVRLDGMLVDITERKDAEEQILNSENKFRTLFDTANDAIFLLDGARLVDCNKKTEEIFLCTRSQIINKFAYDISPEFQSDGTSSVTKATEKIDLALAGIPQLFEWEHRRFDGTVFSCEITLNRVMILGKSMVQAIIRDITEKKKAQKVQNILYQISEAINSTDNIETLYKKIHESVKELMPANNFYIALYDEEAHLVSFPYFVDEYDSPPEPRELQGGLTEYVLRTGKEMMINEELDNELKQSGEVESVGEPAKIWLGVPLKISDMPIGVLAIQDYRDEHTYSENDLKILNYVSEHIAFAISKKSAEEKLKKYASDLKDLNASKDKFFSIISHDLRSPFHALFGLTEIMANDIVNLTEEEIKNFNQEIYKNLRNLYRLIDNLLEWSRIQTGAMRYRPGKLDLNKKVRDIINMLRGNALKKGIHIDNCISGEVFLNADEDMIQSIVQNLLSNAIKFTEQGGKIIIQAQRKEHFCEISIADNGIGIRECDLDKLFRIDSHHSTLGTAREKGTGIGLILCKELVEKHGGKLWVKSEFQKGTAFDFTIPIWDLN